MGVSDLLNTALSFAFNTALPLAFGVFVLCAGFWRFWASPSRKLPYPPGPPQSSLISGNASVIPRTKPWITYTEWAKEYGPIFHCRVYNQHIIVLSSIEVCVELFERRSALYSDRPHTPMAELLGWDFTAAMMPYGARWRGQRRLLQQAFKPDALLVYKPSQIRKVNDLLHGLLSSPEDFQEHAKTVTAAILMSTMYGYEVTPKGDYFVALSEDANIRLSQAIFSPAAFALNMFPYLRFLPSWFPGAGFQKFAAETRELTKQMQEVPLKHVETQIASGNVPNCMAADHLKRCKSAQEYVALREFASTTYVAGAETTTAAVETFFYAMAISPEVQGKAQHELDIVVGTARIPTFDDRPSLPYIEAVYREILRWRPVAPLGLAHAITEDDVYEGYLIPKGATVIPNVWAIAHNPEKYKNPELFNPDRFLDSDGELNDDDVEYTFGFGRRLCPGRHMASDTLWLAIAATLSTFVIGKKKDKFGKEISIAGEYTDGLASHPLPHACSIIPRSDEAKHLIMAVSSQTAKSERL